LLLCSDGLSDNLSTDEIIRIIRHGDLTDAVMRLVEETRRRMTADNQPDDHPSKPDDLTIVAFRRLPGNTTAPTETETISVDDSEQ
ncbi:MAG: hypothetical protein KDA85_18740, partial [Planctomycetaceae bacterium]|nr:hypothetical protein [Planctomycetaceae bacterium]